MDITVFPGALSGTVAAPASKSCAHRVLICAALARGPADIRCGAVGEDVQATVRCLQALGARITKTNTGFHVEPVSHIPEKALLPCGESGSTLRFLLPVAGALGVEATFFLEGRLPRRPLSPLWEEMERMGCQLSRPTENTVLCRGRLRPGHYRLSGSVSSQFISGLLMARLAQPGITVSIPEDLASRPYVALTEQILAHRPARVEGDWSSAAFFLGANALGSRVTVTGLEDDSLQGDKAIRALLGMLRVSARDVPDLIPILAVAAAFRQGCRFTDIARLRAKESDRVEAIASLITSLGGSCDVSEHTLTVHPMPLLGGRVDAKHDHRIAMAAAIAATACQTPVTILGAECAAKSYPHFWEDFQMLGGKL